MRPEQRNIAVDPDDCKASHQLIDACSHNGKTVLYFSALSRINTVCDEGTQDNLANCVDDFAVEQCAETYKKLTNGLWRVFSEIKDEKYSGYQNITPERSIVYEMAFNENHEIEAFNVSKENVLMTDQISYEHADDESGDLVLTEKLAVWRNLIQKKASKYKMKFRHVASYTTSMLASELYQYSVKKKIGCLCRVTHQIKSKTAETFYFSTLDIANKMNKNLSPDCSLSVPASSSYIKLYRLNMAAMCNYVDNKDCGFKPEFLSAMATCVTWGHF